MPPESKSLLQTVILLGDFATHRNFGAPHRNFGAPPEIVAGGRGPLAPPCHHATAHPRAKRRRTGVGVLANFTRAGAGVGSAPAKLWHRYLHVYIFNLVHSFQ